MNFPILTDEWWARMLSSASCSTPGCDEIRDSAKGRQKCDACVEVFESPYREEYR